MVASPAAAVTIRSPASRGAQRNMRCAKGARRERARCNLTGTTQHLRLEPADLITLTLADSSTQRVRVVSAQFGAGLNLRVEAVAEATAWRLAGSVYDLVATMPGNTAFGSVPAGLAVPASYWTWDEVNSLTVMPINGGSRIVGATEAEALNGSESFRFPGAFETVDQLGTVSRIATGRAERPLAPASIHRTRHGSNNLTITWVRRTRIGGEWLDLTGDAAGRSKRSL